MINYPVRITEQTAGHYVAELVDLSDGPRGQGTSEEAAYADLTGPATELLARLMAEGKEPTPSAAVDGYVIAVSPLLPFGPEAPVSNTTNQRKPRPLETYSWTNRGIIQEN
jgi:predicted RNase H-like HicB family nuclease